MKRQGLKRMRRKLRKKISQRSKEQVRATILKKKDDEKRRV